MTVQLRVWTEELKRLAEAYDKQADRFDSRIQTFSATAHVAHGAFGDLGEAHDARNSYLESVDAAVSVFKGAVQELRARARDLHAMAQRYERADEESRF